MVPIADEAATSTITERRMARTRRELAAAAGRLFLERGYDATTIDDIVGAVDVSPRTFFRYFAHKEGIVTALAQLGMDDVIAAVRRRPLQEPFLEALVVAVCDVMDGTVPSTAPSGGGAAGSQSPILDQRQPQDSQTFFAMLKTTPALRARWLDEIHQHRGDLEAVLAERIPTLEPGSLVTQVVAGAVLAALMTAMEQWSASPEGTPVADPVRRALAVLQQPLLPKR